ncbi:THO complex subunit 4C [Quillaja saponaria]|uniref:THO complex subunit 4C n=1 Tax=Quillaja saponaria TaxID=32244 RepID=A0AAD7LMK1_QUISA|nr:THO complex subunit 4C [Quillaja saponaria]
MASSLDVSLDDRIKNRSNRERGRGRGRAHRGRVPGVAFSVGRMSGAARRGPLTVNARPSSYVIAKSIHRTRSFPWQHDLFEDGLRAAGIQGVEVGTKLYVSNLDYGVTNEDIRELFAEIGDLKRYSVHYDKNGHPNGSAEVVYTRRSDAFAALKKYNDVLLDGRPMKIEIVGYNAELPVSARVNVSGVNGRKKRTLIMTPGPAQTGGPAVANRGPGWIRRGTRRNGSDRGTRRSGSDLGPTRNGSGRGQGQGRGRAIGGGGRGRGHSRGKKEPVEKSANELDKELETYHAEAMNIS